jgi:hypothetical protein
MIEAGGVVSYKTQLKCFIKLILNILVVQVIWGDEFIYHKIWQGTVLESSHFDDEKDMAG